MGGVLDRPVRPDGDGGLGGGYRCAREIARDMGCAVPQAGLGISGQDVSLDPDDGRDAGPPVRVGDGVTWIKYGNMAHFLPVASSIGATGAIERRLARAELVSLPMQGWLVFFDLNDQADIGVRGDLECFFGSVGRPASRDGGQGRVQ
jgi:hypothetical protein